MANFTLTSGLLTGSLVVLGMAVTAPNALAQSSDSVNSAVVDPNAGFSSPEGNRGNLLDDSTSALDLIHRAVLMNNMSLDEFSSQFQGQVSQEASSFQQRQQEAIRQQSAQQAATEPQSTDNPAQ